MWTESVAQMRRGVALPATLPAASPCHAARREPLPRCPPRAPATLPAASPCHGLSAMRRARASPGWRQRRVGRASTSPSRPQTGASVALKATRQLGLGRESVAEMPDTRIGRLRGDTRLWAERSRPPDHARGSVLGARRTGALARSPAWPAWPGPAPPPTLAPPPSLARPTCPRSRPGRRRDRAHRTHIHSWHGWCQDIPPGASVIGAAPERGWSPGPSLTCACTREMGGRASVGARTCASTRPTGTCGRRGPVARVSTHVTGG